MVIKMVSVTRQRVILDIKRVARVIAKKRGLFSRDEYRRLGNYASSTVEARFNGSFTNAVRAAGVRNSVFVS
jgi:hypothetical protein